MTLLGSITNYTNIVECNIISLFAYPSKNSVELIKNKINFVEICSKKGNSKECGSPADCTVWFAFFIGDTKSFHVKRLIFQRNSWSHECLSKILRGPYLHKCPIFSRTFFRCKNSACRKVIIRNIVF